MAECRWMQNVERWTDGEASKPDAVAKHLASCPACQAYERRLRMLRDGVAAVSKTDMIGDSRFPAFMEELRERRARRPRWSLAWKLVPVAAAILIVLGGSLYTYEMLTVPGPPIVESASTEIEDAAVTTYATNNGVTTVWVVSQDNDVW
jgi:anti-sigma factor RsiW